MGKKKKSHNVGKDSVRLEETGSTLGVSQVIEDKKWEQEVKAPSLGRLDESKFKESVNGSTWIWSTNMVDYYGRLIIKAAA